jgi:hypothetical protein
VPHLIRSRPVRHLVLVLLLAPFGLNAEEAPAEPPAYFPQRVSAAELLKACASSRLTAAGRTRRAYCEGFVSGVEESLRLAGRNAPALASSHCVPAEVSARQLAEGYVAYAGKRPAQALQQPAAAVVSESLAQAYPCP